MATKSASSRQARSWYRRRLPGLVGRPILVIDADNRQGFNRLEIGCHPASRRGFGRRLGAFMGGRSTPTVTHAELISLGPTEPFILRLIKRNYTDGTAGVTDHAELAIRIEPHPLTILSDSHTNGFREPGTVQRGCRTGETENSIDPNLFAEAIRTSHECCLFCLHETVVIPGLWWDHKLHKPQPQPAVQIAEIN